MEILIGENEFLAGESSSSFINDKGFSPSSTQLNPFYKPGNLYFQPTETARGSGTIVANIVAAAYDKTSLGNDAYFADVSGNFYTLSGSTFTKRQTMAADSLVLGTSDMIQFKGITYATTQTRVVIVGTNNDLTSGFDSGWWTGLNNGYRHPLEVVEDKMYIGDTNIIYSWDGTTSTAAITLPTDANITSLRRHPDGRHLIAFAGFTQDFSHQKGGPGKIYIVNKDTLAWEREIQVDTQVEGSRNVGGTIFVTYGQKLGYFTGDGIKFLKKLSTSTTTYSQSMGNMEDVLLVRDGLDCLAYADFGKGRGWFRIFRNSSANAVQVVIYKGNNKILFADAGGNCAEVDYASTPGVNGTFYTKRYYFGSTVKIRRVEILHSAATGGSFVSLTYIDSEDNSNTVETQDFSTLPTGSVPTRTRFNVDVTTDMFQLAIPASQPGMGIKLIRIYADPVNV